MPPFDAPGLDEGCDDDEATVSFPGDDSCEAGVAVAVSEYEVAASPAGAGATTLRSMSSARIPFGAKYFAMMELIPLLLLSSSEKSS